MSDHRLHRAIAYALVCYDAKHSGVFKKILDQVTLWRSLGHTVQLFVISDEESQILWKEIDKNCVILIDSTLKSKICNRFKLISLAAISAPSVIYLRDQFPLRIPRVRTPIIIEVQSLVGQELRIRSKLRYTIFTLLKRMHYRNLAGAIFVTSELMQLNESRFHSKIPKMTIGNSINLSRITALPPQPGIKPALFFICTLNQAWQGISELVEFARANPDIQVEIVGASEESTAPNVTFHGFLNLEDYWSVAAKCVAGVGPLNSSVKKMTESSSLKVREYLALGLPVVLKYRDTDLESKDNFVLQLPCDGRQLSDFSTEIRSFLEDWTHKRVRRSQILHLDATIKEDIRLRFFEIVINQFTNEKL